MEDQDRLLVRISAILTLLSFVASCASLIVLAFIAGRLTGANDTPVRFLSTPVPTIASAVPTLRSTSVPTIVFVPQTLNLLNNGDLDEDDFGTIANWGQTNVDLYRWYLVQDVPPGGGNENTRWIERVDLTQEERGFGLRSVDYQGCSYFCSVTALQIVPAEANEIYTLSAEARREQGNGASLYLDFLDGSRMRIEVTTQGGYSDQWSEQTVTARAPAGTKFIRVALYSRNAAQGIVYWDNVELRVGEE